MNQYSQNFILARQLISRLVRNTNISKDDLVLDIGAGQGTISQDLVKRAKQVIAIENDSDLVDKLNTIFKTTRNIEILNIDIEKYRYPEAKFKVFSNIPFNLTSSILKKLLDSRYFIEGYIVMQLDATYRYCGEYLGVENTLLSSFYGAIFDLDIYHKFSPDDFIPSPKYKCVMLHIQRKKKELIDYELYSKYRDYVAYVFNTKNGIKRLVSRKMELKLVNELGYDRDLRPSLLSIQQHVDLFNHITEYIPTNLSITRGSYTTYMTNEKKNIKIFRTRRDKDWRDK